MAWPLHRGRSGLVLHAARAFVAASPAGDLTARPAGSAAPAGLSGV